MFPRLSLIPVFILVSSTDEMVRNWEAVDELCHRDAFDMSGVLARESYFCSDFELRRDLSIHHGFSIYLHDMSKLMWILFDDLFINHIGMNKMCYLV